MCQKDNLERLVNFYQYNIFFCVQKCQVLSRISVIYGNFLFTSSIWFKKFKNGEFDSEDKERSRRPKVYEDVELKTLLDQDSC